MNFNCKTLVAAAAAASLAAGVAASTTNASAHGIGMMGMGHVGPTTTNFSTNLSTKSGVSTRTHLSRIELRRLRLLAAASAFTAASSQYCEVPIYGASGRVIGFRALHVCQ
jgi:hypothetical protein